MCTIYLRILDLMITFQLRFVCFLVANVASNIYFSSSNCLIFSTSPFQHFPYFKDISRSLSSIGFVWSFRHSDEQFIPS